MRKRRVVLQLVPGRLDVVLFERGARIASRRIDVAFESDAVEWAKTVRRTAPTLRTAIEEFKAVGLPAITFYRSPTQAVDLSGFEVRSAGAAMQAATLGCVDSLPYTALSAVTDAVAIGHDRSGESRQHHVVSVAEREDIAEAITECLQEAGLKVDRIMPLDAMILTGIASRAMQNTGSAVGSLYIGEQSTFFVVSAEGNIVFSRHIDLGIETLVQALTRPLIPAPGMDSIELPIETARTIVHQFGIPERQAVLLEEPHVVGGAIIPLLQPVLQRFLVELRQSIRFGVPESSRAALTLRMAGPGATLPGLHELIVDELGIETACDEGAKRYDWTIPGSSAGELTDAFAFLRAGSSHNLLPKPMREQRIAGSIRRWLYAGAAAAIALVLLELSLVSDQLADARARSAQFENHEKDLAALVATREQLDAEQVALNSLNHEIEQSVGPGPHLRAVLNEFTRVTPETVRLMSLTFRRHEAGMVGAIAGIAFDDSGVPLEEYIDELRNSPLLADVTLGNVSRDVVNARPCRRFEATLEPVMLPRFLDDEIEVVSAVSSEGSSP